MIPPGEVELTEASSSILQATNTSSPMAENESMRRSDDANELRPVTLDMC